MWVSRFRVAGFKVQDFGFRVGVESNLKKNVRFATRGTKQGEHSAFRRPVGFAVRVRTMLARHMVESPWIQLGSPFRIRSLF